MKIFRLVLFLVAALSVILLLGTRLLTAGKTNLINVNIMKGGEVAVASNCSTIWLTGMSAGRRGDQYVQYQASTEALHCSRDYLPLVRSVFPNDRVLAELSTQLYPDSSDAWFWLGEVVTQFDKLEARQAYLRAVELDPRFGLAWCHLGKQFEEMGEIENASEAFLNCCMNGDPGFHGCLGAGRTMEKLGNPQQAIIYYRYSSFDKALDRADELEKQISP